MTDEKHAVTDKTVGIALPNVYFNGFQLSLSNADVNAILLLNGSPQMGLSMSYTSAKTLHAHLGNLIQTLESVTGRQIMTIDEVAKGMEKVKNSVQ